MYLLKLKIFFGIFFYKLKYKYFKVSTRFLYAQAYHETGGFTSPVFKKNNNLFGMRQPSKRKTLATGSNLKHATFKNHFDSIQDYFLRQKDFQIKDAYNVEYAHSLQNHRLPYAEDPKYIEKWLNVYKTIKYPFNFIYFNIALVLIFSVLIFPKFSTFKNPFKFKFA